MTRAEQLRALAGEIEAARSHYALPNGTDARVVEAFGLEQRLYSRAGWKFIYPDTGRPGSSKRPTASIDDLLSIYIYRRDLTVPPMIPSDPLKATAFCLLALAEQEQ